MPEFPVLSGDCHGVYPADSRCPTCGGDFADGFAYLYGGAVLLTKDRQNSLITDRLEAFLNVGFHGKRSDMRDSEDIAVVDNLCRGQFDMQWCSIGCLRKWLMSLLDELEAGLIKRGADA